jgi:YHS domain-containing protein
MDQMNRTDPTDQNMPDTSGMESLQEMESMRDAEDLLDTEGGIPGTTGPGTQASQGAPDYQWSGSQGMSSQGMSSQGMSSQGMSSQGMSSQGMSSQGMSSQGMSSQGQGQGMDIDPNSPDQKALNPDVQLLDKNDPNVARDPVCGKLVDKRTAQNTLDAPVNMPIGTIYFDSPECKAIFEADPQRFGSNF